MSGGGAGGVEARRRDAGTTAARFNYYLIPVLLLDFTALVCLGVVAALLRFRTVGFLNAQSKPTTFPCTDPSLSTPYRATPDVPDVMVYVTACCLPLSLMLLGEVCQCVLRTASYQSGPALPQLVRRTLHYWTSYLAGTFLLTILVDVSKARVGRLRPHFLAICGPQPPLNTSQLCNHTICTGDPLLVAEARLSFPSFQAAFSTYAALFSAIYIHFTIRVSGMRVAKKLIMMLLLVLSLITSISRYTDGYNHVTDILASIIAATIIAFYICIFSCNGFGEMWDKKLRNRGHSSFNTKANTQHFTNHSNNNNNDNNNNEEEDDNNNDRTKSEEIMLFPSWLKHFKIPRARNPSGQSTNSIQMMSPGHYQKNVLVPSQAKENEDLAYPHPQHDGDAAAYVAMPERALPPYPTESGVIPLQTAAGPRRSLAGHGTNNQQWDYQQNQQWEHQSQQWDHGNQQYYHHTTSDTHHNNTTKPRANVSSFKRSLDRRVSQSYVRRFSNQHNRSAF